MKLFPVCTSLLQVSILINVKARGQKIVRKKIKDNSLADAVVIFVIILLEYNCGMLVNNLVDSFENMKRYGSATTIAFILPNSFKFNDIHRNSPYDINRLSSRYVMRIKIAIN